MESNKYTKLSQLVDNTFRVQAVKRYCFKKYDPQQGKMLSSDTWQEGFRKVWELDTDKGKLDLSSSQLGSCLEAVFSNGKADLTNEQIYVKSNGKTGIDIRYFFNKAKDEAPAFDPPQNAPMAQRPLDELGGEPVDLSDIPY